MGADIVRLKLQFDNFVDAPPTPPPSTTTTTTTTTSPTEHDDDDHHHTGTAAVDRTTATVDRPPATVGPIRHRRTHAAGHQRPPRMRPRSDTAGAAAARRRPATSTGLPTNKLARELVDVVRLAEQTGLYVELTGLGIENDADTGTWYDQLDEPSRWAAQAVFWSAVAGAVKDPPGIAWLDLMSEPVGDGVHRSQWCAGISRSGLRPSAHEGTGNRTPVPIAP